MSLSETILAAMIGAIATVSTALFQLFTAFRSRSKADTRPKKGTATRSILAILALMVASAAGGFLYSEFLKQRAGEDMRAMRVELKELKALITEVRHAPIVQPAAAEDWASRGPAVISTTAEDAEDSAESVVYVPACRRGDVADCAESDAQRIALCGSIPAYAQVRGIELFVQPDAVQHPWESHRAAFEQDLGGARFTGKSFEYAQGEDIKAVCVNFMHWSSQHPHIARIVVQYGFGNAPAAPGAVAPRDGARLNLPPVIAADNAPVVPQAASLAAPIGTK